MVMSASGICWRATVWRLWWQRVVPTRLSVFARWHQTRSILCSQTWIPESDYTTSRMSWWNNTWVTKTKSIALSLCSLRTEGQIEWWLSAEVRTATSPDGIWTLRKCSSEDRSTLTNKCWSAPLTTIISWIWSVPVETSRDSTSTKWATCEAYCMFGN